MTHGSRKLGRWGGRSKDLKSLALVDKQLDEGLWHMANSQEGCHQTVTDFEHPWTDPRSVDLAARISHTFWGSGPKLPWKRSSKATLEKPEITASLSARGRYTKVILSKGALQILFITTSTYQSEGSCSQGDCRIIVRGDWAVHLSCCRFVMEHLLLFVQVCQWNYRGSQSIIILLPRNRPEGSCFYRAVKKNGP